MSLSWPVVMQLLATVTEPSVDHWFYENTTVWPSHFPLCGGPLQSPIDLPLSRAKPNYDLTLQIAYGLEDGEIEAVNTGHTARFYFRPKNRNVPIVQFTSVRRAGPLSGTYRFEHMDFHWTIATGYTPGSEHSIDGKFSDAEAQLVFYNTKYASLREAMRHTGGLAIVAILLQGVGPPLSPDFPTYDFEPLIEDIAPRGATIKHHTDLTEFAPMVRRAMSNAINYYGSLTYPPCNPVVNWIVADKIWTVHLEFVTQLNGELFEDVRMQRLMVNNRRPTQTT